MRVNSVFPLAQWRWIVVNSSGGKDSQVALHMVVSQCDAAGYPRSQIVVSHQDLGRMEWAGTRELAQQQAEHYGLRFIVSKRRNAAGEEIELLEQVRRRGKWPDNKNRYCTSDFKRGPGGRVITALSREAPGNILQVFGFRAAESPARKKKLVFSREDRLCTKNREVWNWLPIHHFTTQEVWHVIRRTGVPHHPAYDKGMPRLSCVFCIFAPKAALMIAGKHNPGLLDEYVRVEKEIGHTFQNKKPLADIQRALAEGEPIPEEIKDDWNM